MKVTVGEVYRHYKGGHYVVLCEATHTETGHELVVYRSLTGLGVWARPKVMFLGDVITDGQRKPRFEHVERLS